MMNGLALSPSLIQLLESIAAEKSISIDELIQYWLSLENVRQSQQLPSSDLVLQHVSDAVIATDAHWQITAWNPAAERTYGWTQSEAMGQPLDELLKTQWLYEPYTQVQASLRQNGQWQGEIRQQTKTGQLRYILASVSWVKNSQGELIGAIAVNHDIAERKKAEEAILQSEEKFRLIAENTSDAIMVIDARTGKVVYASSSFDRQFGRSEGMTSGLDVQSIYDIMHPDDRDSVFQNVYKAISNKENSLIYTYRAKHSDGRYLWREDHAKFNYDADHHHINTYVISRDITERKYADALLHARLQLREYAVTHSIDDLMKKAIDEAEKLTDSEIGFFHFVHPDQKHLTLQMWSSNTLENVCQVSESGQHSSVDEAGIWADCIRQRKPIIINDYPSSQHGLELPNGHAPLIRQLSVPILRNDLIVAVLGIGNKSVPYTDADVEVVYQLADMIWDIVAQHKAEKELRQSEERFRLFMEHFPGGVFVQDEQHRLVYCNSNYASTRGYTTDAIIGRYVRDYIRTAKLADSFAQENREVLEANQPKTFEIAYQEAGRTIYWQTLKFPIVFPEGMRQVGGLSFDITEQREAEVTIRLHHTALEAAANAVVITNCNDIIQWINPAFTKLTGYSYEDAVGKHPRDLLRSGQQNSAFYREMDNTIKSGKIWQGKLINRRKDGSFYSEEQTITPVNDSNGKITHFIAIKQDITEREQAEQVRVEQERLKVRLQKEQELNNLIQQAISSLAHDIRTPLSVIKTSKDLLSQYFDRMDEEKKQEKFTSIDRQLQYVIQLMDDLRLAAKSGLNERVFQPTLIDIDVLCKLSVQETQAVNMSAPRLIYVNHSGVTKAYADETLITRILLNLLSNAVKYSPVTSEVHLELDREGDWIVLHVRDHGIGIAEKDLPYIFEPFYRVNNDTVRSIGGTGLGLNIVKDCVERHHGNIEVESKFGIGSTFTVKLPISTE